VLSKLEAINLSSLIMGATIIFTDQAMFGVFTYVEERDGPSILIVGP
jgi:hypothetical protein